MVADTLSRAYLPEVNSRIFVREMEAVDHRANLPVSDERWQQLTYVWADDPVLEIPIVKAQPRAQLSGYRI